MGAPATRADSVSLRRHPRVGPRRSRQVDRTAAAWTPPARRGAATASDVSSPLDTSDCRIPAARGLTN
jgi:hypothetical protein